MNPDGSQPAGRCAATGAPVAAVDGPARRILAIAPLCVLIVAATGTQASGAATRGASRPAARQDLRTWIARGAGVTARLSYRPSTASARRLRLTITGRSRVLFSGRPALPGACAPCAQIMPLGQAGGPLHVRDLDGGAAEVIVDLYSGGAHCCAYSTIYTGVGDRYRPTIAAWGDAGYRIGDLGRDHTVELISRDKRFADKFAANPSAPEPIRIWRFEHRRLRDLTRTYPAAVTRDAHRLLRLYAQQRRTAQPEVRGILAAYLADEYLLGHDARGWALLQTAYARGELGRTARRDGYPAGRRYLAQLRAFLRRTGYAR